MITKQSRVELPQKENFTENKGVTYFTPYKVVCEKKTFNSVFKTEGSHYFFK